MIDVYMLLKGSQSRIQLGRTHAKGFRMIDVYMLLKGSQLGYTC